jgi:hypothetical protein
MSQPSIRRSTRPTRSMDACGSTRKPAATHATRSFDSVPDTDRLSTSRPTQRRCFEKRADGCAQFGRRHLVPPSRPPSSSARIASAGAPSLHTHPRRGTRIPPWRLAAVIAWVECPRNLASKITIRRGCGRRSRYDACGQQDRSPNLAGYIQLGERGRRFVLFDPTRSTPEELGSSR